MTTTPPGWYDDGHGSNRWWDGVNWTAHVAEPRPQPPAEQPDVAPDSATEQVGVASAPVTEQHAADASSTEGSLAPAAASEPPAEAAVAPVEQPALVPPFAGPPTVAAPVAEQSAPAPPYGEQPPATAPPFGSSAYAPYDLAATNVLTATAVEPRKSRMWILWVVLGAVIVGILLIVAIVAPLLWMGLAGGSGSSTAPSAEASNAVSTPEPTTSREEDVVPTADDKDAAAAAVLTNNDAWVTGDCDGFMTTTTEALREVYQINSCDAFAVESRNFADGLEDYVTEIDAVEAVGETIEVSTVETYTGFWDAEGYRTEEAVSYEDRYTYIVVLRDGEWLINNSYLE
jgi:hypothetical protein